MDRGERPNFPRGYPEYLLLEHGYPIAYPGMIISPGPGERWVCPEGHVLVLGQRGGSWVAYGNSRQTVINQRGGLCQTWDNSRQTVCDHGGGWWCSVGNSRQTALNRRGGWWCGSERSRQRRLKPKE